jgi:hypothetical protein
MPNSRNPLHLRAESPPAAIGDCGFGIGDSRAENPGPPRAQNVKQTQSATFGYIALAFRQGIEIRDTRFEIRAGDVSAASNKANLCRFWAEK